MNKTKVIAGIDIGSQIIKTVIAQSPEEGNIWQVLGVGSVLSQGVRKGIVVDAEEVAQAIKESVKIAQHMADVSPSEFWIGVGGNEIEMRETRGVVAIGRSDGEVTENDIERVLESSRNVGLASNKEIIHSIPQQYRLDDQHGIKDPLGMKGVRLEVETVSVECSNYQIKNLFNALQQADISSDGLVLNSLASAEVILDKQQKELGVALVDIGFATTSITIFEEGELIYTTTIPLGSGHITNDIAIGLRVSVATAEKVKLQYGNAFPKDISKKEEIDLSEIDSNEEELVSRYHVAEIIEARLEEIFELINKELKKVGRAGLLPAGVVLIGGGSQLPQIAEFAKEKMGLPSQLGYPHRLSGVLDKVDETSFAVAIGLTMWAERLGEQSQINRNNFWDKIISKDNENWKKIKEWGKKFLP